MKVFVYIMFLSLLIVCSPARAELNGWDEVGVCASARDASRVREAYEQRPGAPMPVPSRQLDLPEVQVTTGLPESNSIGVLTTPEMVKEIWSSIDAWGAETEVHLVFTMGGQHVLDFPSLVPMRQEDLDDGWLDIYADNGDGVHGHLWLAPIRSVHAVDIPATGDKRTRAVNFYTPDGNLAIGVYASMGSKPFDRAAVEGFAGTWRLIESMPRACP